MLESVEETSLIVISIMSSLFSLHIITSKLLAKLSAISSASKTSSGSLRNSFISSLFLFPSGDSMVLPLLSVS